jgi:hypothetical protein
LAEEYAKQEERTLTDEELELKRQKRVKELQARLEAERRVKKKIKNLSRLIFTPEARSRRGSLRLTKPKLAEDVEEVLLLGGVAEGRGGRTRNFLSEIQTSPRPSNTLIPKYRTMIKKPSTKKTGINLGPALWNETKKSAIDKGVTVSQLIEDLIRSELQTCARRNRDDKRSK